MLAFTLTVSLATGLIFGLIPALQSSKTDLTSTLKETGGRSGTGFRQNKTRSILVVTEVALALTLLDRLRAADSIRHRAVAASIPASTPTTC